MKMKKCILPLLCILCATGSLKAQYFGPEAVFPEKSSLVGISVGLFSNLGTPGYRTVIPPLCLDYEYGLARLGEKGTLGLGGIMGFSESRYKGASDDRTGKFALGARAAYHYAFQERFEGFAGILAGYVNEFNHGQDVANSSTDHFAYDFHAGVRYLLNEYVTAFAEASLGHFMSGLNVGLSIRIYKY